MRIHGVIPSVIVNVGIIACVAGAIFYLKDGTPLLGLLMLQPIPIQAVPQSADELRASMGQPDEDEESNPIGFVHS